MISRAEVRSAAEHFVRGLSVEVSSDLDGYVIYWSYRLSDGLLGWIAIDNGLDASIEASVTFGSLKTDDANAVTLLEANSSLTEGLRFYVSAKELVSLGFQLSLENIESGQRLIELLDSLHTVGRNFHDRAHLGQMPFRPFAWARRSFA